MNSILDTFFGLRGRTALVTGGAAGMGYGIARALALAGARLVIADRDAQAAEIAVAKLREAGCEARAYMIDLSKESEIAPMFDAARGYFGTVDILVNNAGSYPKYDFLQITAEQWNAVHQLNLRSLFVCMQQAVKLMLEAGRGGRIINISSVASVHPATIANAHYSASKAGVNALTRGAALEFAGKGITVNAILPGPIASDSPRDPNAPPVIGPAANPQRWITGRMGTIDEVAAAVLFLAGAGGAYTTGQALAVDGGFLVS